MSSRRIGESSANQIEPFAVKMTSAGAAFIPAKMDITCRDVRQLGHRDVLDPDLVGFLRPSDVVAKDTDQSADIV